jgi:hypothetical protein
VRYKCWVNKGRRNSHPRCASLLTFKRNGTRVSIESMGDEVSIRDEGALLVA